MNLEGEIYSYTKRNPTCWKKQVLGGAGEAGSLGDDITGYLGKAGAVPKFSFRNSASGVWPYGRVQVPDPSDKKNITVHDMLGRVSRLFDSSRRFLWRVLYHQPKETWEKMC